MIMNLFSPGRRHCLRVMASIPFAYSPPSPGQSISKGGLPRSPPVWAGFGLNGSAGEGRYEITREFVREFVRKKNLPLESTETFAFIREPLKQLLASQHIGRIQFKDQVEFGEELLIGFAHDFESAVGARLEKDGVSANTLFIFMSGVGMILSFSTSTGWRIVSSFPFMLRVERLGGDLKNIKAKAVDHLEDAYKSYANAFGHFLGRFNKWDKGFSSNYFARLTRASIHDDVKGKLSTFGLQKTLTAELLGFSTSSALCDSLDIPLLPYQENDALAKRYAVKFSDSLTAQNKIEIPDADLKFEIVLRDLDKQVIHSSQRGVTILRRKVVVRMIVYDEYSNLPDKKILNVLASSSGEDRIPLNSTEDDTPERDLVFYDRLLSQTFANLLRGMATQNENTLAQAEVKLSFVAPALPRLLELCAKTRG